MEKCVFKLFRACCKMAKHTLKILRYEHRKIFKVCIWPFYNIMHERIKPYEIARVTNECIMRFPRI